MLKSSLVHLLVLFIVLPSFGQDPTEISAGDALREEGKLEEAIKAYAADYKKDPSDKTNTYNYSCALALNRQVDSAFKYLFLAVVNDTTVRPLSDPDFYYLRKDDRWKKLQQSLVEKVEVKFGKYDNLDLAKELWDMKLKDQAFYYHIKLADNNSNKISPVQMALWELKHMINDKNLARLEEIIEEHGWPKRSQVKGNAAQAAFLIVQHADIETQRKYLPVMKAAAEEGEASWGSLALLIDRVNLRSGEPQIYGSQIHRNEDGSYYVADLKDPQYVNQRRKEVGLPPIEDYVKNWDINWDVEQLEK